MDRDSSARTGEGGGAGGGRNKLKSSRIEASVGTRGENNKCFL